MLTEQPLDIKNCPTHEKRCFTFFALSICADRVAVLCTEGALLNLIALKLGFSTLQLGVLNFFYMATTLIQIVMINTIAKNGKRKVFIYTYSLAALFSGLLLLLPNMANIHMPLAQGYFFVILMIIRCLVFTGFACWFPMIMDNIHHDKIGTFFGHIRMWLHAAGLMLLLGIAWFLGVDPHWWQFQCIFAISIVFYLCRVLSILPIPMQTNHHVSNEIEPLTVRLRRVAKNVGIRRFIAYTFSFHLIVAASFPFQVQLLKSLGYSDGFITAGFALTFSGAILSLKRWGKIADRFGSRAIFTLSHIGLALAMMLWLFVGKYAYTGALVFGYYFIFSLFMSGNGIANARYAIHLSMRHCQLDIIVINTITFVALGLSPLLGACLLYTTDHFAFTLGSITFNNYHLLFAASALGFILPAWKMKALDIKDDPTLKALCALVWQKLNA